MLDEYREAFRPSSVLPFRSGNDLSAPRASLAVRVLCAATDDDPISTVGCNGGFLTTEPAANSPYGTCTPAADPESNPAGSCTDPNAFCVVGENATTGWCFVGCAAGPTYVTTGGCPTGARCFDLGGDGVCFRDCDDTHPCPTGMGCDGEGSCIVEDVAPMMDGGVPTGDGGLPDTDGGAPDSDGGTPDEDGGAPDEDGGAPDEDGGIIDLPDAGIDLPDTGLVP